MKKTFCDVCDKQCVNTTFVLRVARLQHTKKGEYVGDDEYQPIELCSECINVIKEFMPDAFTLQHHSDVPGETAARFDPREHSVDAPVRVHAIEEVPHD